MAQIFNSRRHILCYISWSFIYMCLVLFLTNSQYCHPLSLLCLRITFPFYVILRPGCQVPVFNVCSPPIFILNATFFPPALQYSSLSLVFLFSFTCCPIIQSFFYSSFRWPYSVPLAVQYSFLNSAIFLPWQCNSLLTFKAFPITSFPFALHFIFSLSSAMFPPLCLSLFSLTCCHIIQSSPYSSFHSFGVTFYLTSLQFSSRSWATGRPSRSGAQLLI